LPKAANHAKKAALGGACVHHTLFQGNLLPSKYAKEIKNNMTLKRPLFEELHHNQSSNPRITLATCNTWKKEAKTSTSQS
jgi:hypothetical protein